MFGFTSGPLATKLEYTFKVGDEYLVTQVIDQTMKQNIMGMEQRGETKGSYEMKYKVVSVAGNTAKVEAQFIKLRQHSTTMMGEIVWDSEGTDETDLNKLVKSMMKKTFIVTMNKFGRAETIEGHENLLADVTKLGIDKERLAGLKQTFEQMYDKNSLKNSFEQAMVFYPDKKIIPGDQWEAKQEFPMGFPIAVDNTWSLVSINGSTGQLSASGICSTSDKEKILDLVNGMKAKVDLSGKQGVKSSVNVKTGWPAEKEINSELKGKMILLAGGMLPMDMEVPVELIAKTTFKFVKK